MSLIGLIALAVLAVLISKLLTARPTRAVLAGLATSVWVWTGYTLVKILPDFAGFVAKQFLTTSERFGPTMIAVIVQLMREISGVEITPQQAADLGRGGTLLEFGKAIARGPGQRIFDAVVPPASLTPEGAKRHLEDLIGISTAFALDDWWDKSFIEMLSLGQLQWLADLSNAVAQGFGLGKMSSQAMRLLIKGTLGPPLEVYFNRLYTPARLSAPQAIEAGQQQLITETQMLGALADEGYDHRTASVLVNLRQRELSLDQIERLNRLGRIPDAGIPPILRRLGYGEARAQLVAEDLASRRSGALLDDVADVARRLYRSGDVNADGLRQLLRQAKYRPAEIDLILVREELALREERALTKGEILEGYREGALDTPEARALLKDLRYGPRAIDLLLAAQRKVLSPAQVIDALTRGIVDKGTALTRLVAQGYSQEDAQLLVDLRQLRLTPGQILDAFGRGLLPLDRARDFLIELGYDREQTELVLSFQRRTLAPADVTAALVRGLVTEEAARDRLLALGYSPEDARLLLALRFQLLSAGQVLDGYEAGLVTRRSALERLQALGFTAEDAEILLLRFEVKIDRAGRMRPPAG